MIAQFCEEKGSGKEGKDQKSGGRKILSVAGVNVWFSVHYEAPVCTLSVYEALLSGENILGENFTFSWRTQDKRKSIKCLGSQAKQATACGWPATEDRRDSHPRYYPWTLGS